MKVSDAYPSEYLKAADLQGRNVPAVISHVEMRDLGDDTKPVLFFQNKKKGVALNKTNANNIAMAYGDEMDDWVGKEVILYEAYVDFQGKSVAAIRIRAPQPKDRQNGAPKTVTASTEPRGAATHRDMDDEIPF